jgi:hypothetical protein
MTEPAPRIDFANPPAAAEGLLVTLFITVRKVARSRDSTRASWAAPNPDENRHVRLSTRGSS